MKYIKKHNIKLFDVKFICFFYILKSLSLYLKYTLSLTTEYLPADLHRLAVIIVFHRIMQCVADD